MFQEIDRPLRLREILEEVHLLSIGKRLKYYETLGSTNDVACHLAESGEEEGMIIIADEQTAGKGRQNRSWSSARFKGIYLSVILRPETEALLAPRFTMMASVSAARAIEDLTGLKADIKWPNDITIRRKKVAGILAEMKVLEQAVKFLIIGVGINVNQLEADFPDEIVPFSTSLLLESKEAVSREKVIIRLLTHFNDLYPSTLAKDFSSILEEWKERSPCHHDCRVLVKNGDLSYRGITRGVTDLGELIVELGSGKRKPLSFGDLTIIPGDEPCS